MSKKEKNIQIFSEKLKDKDFKIKLNPAKLVFPIHYSIVWMESKYEYYLSILCALNHGTITSTQATSYKQTLKERIKENSHNTDYHKLYEKIRPYHEYGLNGHVRLGDLQVFFKDDNKETGWGGADGIFNTKDVLIRSFEYYMRNNDTLSTDVDKFFQYLPYLKTVLKDCPLKPNLDGYCCEDCSGDWNNYVRNKYQHLADMAKITLDHKIKDTY